MTAARDMVCALAEKMRAGMLDPARDEWAIMPIAERGLWLRLARLDVGLADKPWSGLAAVQKREIRGAWVRAANRAGKLIRWAAR